MAEAGAGSTSGYFAVNVKKDCPHLTVALKDDITVDIQAPCVTCSNVGENWLCLTCSTVFCSRYVKEHMVQHNVETQHPVALSFSDASVWCYSCESCKHWFCEGYRFTRLESHLSLSVDCKKLDSEVVLVRPQNWDKTRQRRCHS